MTPVSVSRQSKPIDPVLDPRVHVVRVERTVTPGEAHSRVELQIHGRVGIGISYRTSDPDLSVASATIEALRRLAAGGVFLDLVRCERIGLLGTGAFLLVGIRTTDRNGKGIVLHGVSTQGEDMWPPSPVRAVLHAVNRWFEFYVGRDWVHDFFISYARSDAEVVYQIVSLIENAGWGVWLDRQGLRAGQSFPEITREAIRTARAGTLIFWTEASSRSDWVMKEVQQAKASGNGVVPVLISGDPALIPKQWRLDNFLDLRGWKGELDPRWDQLKDTLTKIYLPESSVVVPRPTQ